MAPQATKSITLTATTSAGNCPAINNTATVSSDGDTNSSNNTSGPVKITVNCTADVKVVKTTTTPIVTAGGQASYGITVTAIGPASSTHVVLTDALPAGLTWTVGGTDKASCSPASPVAGGTTLTCNFGTMAPQATKSITLTATTPAANCPAINNTATVSSDTDTNASNNTSGPVKITVNCVCVDTTFKFSGDTASSGTKGNIRTFTVNGRVREGHRVQPHQQQWRVGDGLPRAVWTRLGGHRRQRERQQPDAQGGQPGQSEQLRAVRVLRRRS